MRNLAVAILLLLLTSGCVSYPREVGKEKLNHLTEKYSTLTGYYRAYLGSDKDYHYIRIGICTGYRDYKIPKPELFIEEECLYFKDNPTIRPLRISTFKMK